MSDFARANSGGSTHFTDKDGLTTGDPNKLIVGSQFDAEFNAILTAVNSKYDSADLASTAEAQAETLNTVLITPSSLADWSDSNAGIVGELHAAADPNADGLLMWDDSQAANSNIQFCTAGTALAFNGTTIEMSHLGIEDLAGPGADRILFWDQSGVATAWLTVSTGLTLSGTNLTWDGATAAGTGLTHSTGVLNVIGGDGITANANDIALTAASVSATNPISVASGVIQLDVSSLTTIDCASIAGADMLFIDDGGGGTNKTVAYQDFGIPTTTSASTSIGPVISDANRMYVTTAATAVTFTIPANASVAYPVGTCFVIHQNGAGQVTVAVTTDTLRSPNGAKTAAQYSMIQVTKVATTEWVVTGDSTA